MKSFQLHLKSPVFAPGRPLIRKSFAALFAGALALGLSVSSVLAQGPYYPQANPTGGAPFVPNGVPIGSSSEFLLIENNLPAAATLITPPIGGDHTASAAEYAAGVKEAAKIVVQGGGGAVTIASLAAEVAKYRSDVLQVQGALTGFAQGIVASAASNAAKQSALEGLVFTAAKTSPSGLSGANTMLTGVFAAAAGDVSLATGVNLLVAQAVSGAGSSPALATSPAGIYNTVANAASAIAGSAAFINKPAILISIASTVAATPAVSGSTANLDATANALTTSGLQSYVTLTTMLMTLKTAGGGTDIKDGAIAQGALRVVGNRTLAGYSAVKSGLANTTYTTELVDSFSNLSAGNANAGLVAASFAPTFPEAAAAAAAVKNPAQAGVAVGLILDNGYAPATRMDIVGRAVGAYQIGASAIASAALGHGLITPGEVTYAATFAAQIGSAGAITKAVVLGAGPASAVQVAQNAISAAAAASPVANKQNAFADIAFNLANALKTAPAASVAAVNQTVLSVIANTTGVPATAPTYIAVVGALAGDQKANFAAILAAGLAASAGDDDAATSAGAALVNAITNAPLSNYQATLTAAAGANTDNKALAVLYAAILSNSGDAAGGLAALINSSPNILAPKLTEAAISASRTKQTALSVVSEVALFTKINPNQIQAYIGRQIITNPTAVKEITTAATVVAPQFSHFIAHTLAFNTPKTAHDSVGGIFLHSKITIAGTLAIGDRPAAGAAITAALTTGILESTQLSAADRKTALQTSLVESIKALVNPAYNDATAGPATFRQSDGFGGVTLIKAKGVAGGITGFTAQLVNPGDVMVSTDLTNALFQATYAAALLTGTGNILDIAQAAGQAFGWVSGTPNRAAGVAAATAIANAISSAYPFNAARVLEAVNFGIDEAAGGTIVNNPARLPGAGAAGLRLTPAQPFYDHHSASGNPVSNIFTL